MVYAPAHRERVGGRGRGKGGGGGCQEDRVSDTARSMITRVRCNEQQRQQRARSVRSGSDSKGAAVAAFLSDPHCNDPSHRDPERSTEGCLFTRPGTREEEPPPVDRQLREARRPPGASSGQQPWPWMSGADERLTATRPAPHCSREPRHSQCGEAGVVAGGVDERRGGRVDGQSSGGRRVMEREGAGRRRGHEGGVDGGVSNQFTGKRIVGLGEGMGGWAGAWTRAGAQRELGTPRTSEMGASLSHLPSHRPAPLRWARRSPTSPPIAPHL